MLHCAWSTCNACGGDLKQGNVTCSKWSKMALVVVPQSSTLLKVFAQKRAVDNIETLSMQH